MTEGDYRPSLDAALRLAPDDAWVLNLAGLAAVGEERTADAVITSYSIHYTKLYESVSVNSEIQHKPVNVVLVLRRALDLVSSRFRKKNLIIDFTPQSDKIIAIIDNEVLMQVCLNLILNAVDAMSEGMRFRVEADYYGVSRVRLLFANEGIPIPDDVKSRIFDPFFTTKKTGTGLGLSIRNNFV